MVANAEYYHVYACIGGFEGMKSGGKVSVQEIEGGTYAVFRFSGPYADFDKVYCYIYRYWLPRNKYELRDIPFFEKYLSAPADISSDDLLADIYVPVEKIKER